MKQLIVAGIVVFVVVGSIVFGAIAIADVAFRRARRNRR